jgi:drug/metabolite transporter (DMT)-like permease
MHRSAAAGWWAAMESTRQASRSDNSGRPILAYDRSGTPILAYRGYEWAPMKRDLTVPLSLVMIVASLCVAAARGMPRRIDPSLPLIYHVCFWTYVIGTLRSVILWFQTLRHGIRHSDGRNRAAVIVAHVLLGVLMAYGYYFWTRSEDPVGESEADSRGGG